MKRNRVDIVSVVAIVITVSFAICQIGEAFHLATTPIGLRDAFELILGAIFGHKFTIHYKR